MDVPSMLNIMTAFIKMVVVILVVVFVAFVAFPGFIQVFGENEAERFSLDSSAILLSSDLVAYPAVFNPEKLNEINGSVQEPFGRLCDYGYFATVKDLETGREWKFGYSPADPPKKEEMFTKTFKAGILKKGDWEFYDNVSAATLTMRFSRTLATRIGCIAEKAHASGTVQSFVINDCSMFLSSCSIEVKQQAGALCVNGDCRASIVPLASFSGELKEGSVLAAVPGESCSSPQSGKQSSVVLCVM